MKAHKLRWSLLGEIPDQMGIQNTLDKRGITGIGIQGLDSFGRSAGDLGNIGNNYRIDTPNAQSQLAPPGWTFATGTPFDITAPSTTTAAIITHRVVATRSGLIGSARAPRLIQFALKPEF